MTATPTAGLPIAGARIQVDDLRRDGMTWAEIAALSREQHLVGAMESWRLAHGWTREEAAKQFTMRWPDQEKTSENFKFWESWPGSQGLPPHLFNLLKLAELYQCSVSDLLQGIGDFRHLDEVAAERREQAVAGDGDQTVDDSPFSGVGHDGTAA